MSEPTHEPVHASALEELSRLKEEVKLKFHLAGMEAKTFWEEDLLPQLDHLESGLRNAGQHIAAETSGALDDETRLELHLGLAEARDRWHKVEPYICSVVDKVKELGDQAAHALTDLPDERSKLQATLARMEAEDALAERRERVEGQLKDAEAEAGKLWRSVLSSLREAFEKLND